MGRRQSALADDDRPQSAHEVIDLINEAANDCAIHGRTVARALVGADAFSAIWRDLMVRVGLKDDGARYIRFQTVAGEVSLEVRCSLFESVIVEDTTGEPWIATPGRS